MTDELITNLAQIGSVRVISRTSIMQYKGARKALPKIVIRTRSPARTADIETQVDSQQQRATEQSR